MSSFESNKKLVFVPSAFRDWTVIYCQFAWMDWVSEFKKQFDWSVSDICFVYNGDNTVMYRAPEEHLLALYEKMSELIKKDNDFLYKIANNLEKEVLKSEKFYKALENKDFDLLTLDELGNIFLELQKYTVEPTPKFLIAIYLPQAVEFMGKKLKDEEFVDGLKELMRVRGKTDHIIAPLGNLYAEKIAQAVLKEINIDIKYGRFLSMEEMFAIVEKGDDFSVGDTKNLEGKLKSRTEYFLIADGKIYETTLKDYLEDRGWSLEEFDLEIREIKGVVAHRVDELIKGTVRVILNKSQLSKVREGDVLVAPMTTPEYAPVLGKVKAIITDEGGVTSHAAM